MNDTVAGVSPEDFAQTAALSMDACGGGSVTAIAERLGADGLLGVLASEAVGGLGLPLDFAVPIAAAAGAAVLPLPLIETLLLSRALQAENPALAEALVAGQTVATIAWAGSAHAVRKDEGFRVSGALARAPFAGEVDWIALRLEEGGIALVERTADGVEIVLSEGLGADQPEFELSVDTTLPAERVLPASVAETLEEDALLLRAALIQGSAEVCLARSSEHVITRRQFGRALVANQAIRHKLARQKLTLEGMKNAIARSLAPADAADVVLRRRAAFVAAARGGIAISEDAIQLHGGMGFTWELPIHHHLRQMRLHEAQGNLAGVLLSIADDTLAGIEPAGTQ